MDRHEIEQLRLTVSQATPGEWDIERDAERFTGIRSIAPNRTPESVMQAREVSVGSDNFSLTKPIIEASEANWRYIARLNPRVVGQLLDDLTAAWGALDRIDELHEPVPLFASCLEHGCERPDCQRNAFTGTYYWHLSEPDGVTCAECFDAENNGGIWPCPTIRARVGMPES